MDSMRASPAGSKPRAPKEASGLPPLLTSESAARLAGMGVKTLWRLTAKGEFPAPVHVTSRVVRWRTRDVLDWLERKVGAA